MNITFISPANGTSVCNGTGTLVNGTCTNSTLPHGHKTHDINIWTEWIADQSPFACLGVVVAAIWLFTTIGFCSVCTCRRTSNHMMAVLYGLSSGVFISSATLGLLDMALRYANEDKWSTKMVWIPIVIGFLIGVILLQALTFFAWILQWLGKFMKGKYRQLKEKPKAGEPDETMLKKLLKGIEKRHMDDEDDDDNDSESASMSDGQKLEDVEYPKHKTGVSSPNLPVDIAKEAILVTSNQKRGIVDKARRAVMIVVAIILQQIPEGFILGATWGMIRHAKHIEGGRDHAVRVVLAASIGSVISAFPDGIIMTLPVMENKVSRWKACIWTQTTIVVQIVCAYLGCTFVHFIRPILPFALAAAAGAMIFVAVSEMIPSAMNTGKRLLANSFFLFGFCLMIVLINLFDQS